MLTSQDLDGKVRDLRTAPIFSGVPDDEMQKVAVFFTHATYPAGHTFDDPNFISFIVRGEASLCSSRSREADAARSPGSPASPPSGGRAGRRGSLRELGHLAPGSSFGEAAMFPDLRRNWFVNAKTEITVLSANLLQFKGACSDEIRTRLRDSVSFRVSYHDERETGGVERLRQLSNRRLDLAGVLQNRFGDYLDDDDDDNKNGGRPTWRGLRSGAVPVARAPHARAYRVAII